MPSTTTSTVTKLTFFAISVTLSFLLGREYEQNKLQNTYISQRETDETTNRTIEKRFYYR